MAVELVSEIGDPWRWVVLIIFSVYSCSNAIQWVTFAPIATSVREFFNLTTSQLNWLSTVYMIVFVIGAYLTCTTFERWGVRWGVLIGCFLNTLGSVLKVAPGLQLPSYTTMIIPQTLNSISQLFVLSTPPLIAAQYFAPRQRAFATAVAATANNLGNAIALLVPPFIVQTGTRGEFTLLFSLQLGLCALSFIAAIFFLRPPRFKAPSKELLRHRAASNAGDAAGGANGDAEECLSAGGPQAETIAEEPASEAATSGVRKPCAPAVVGAADGTTAITSYDDREDADAIEQPKTCWGRVRANQQLHTFVEVARTLLALFRNFDFVMLLGAFSVGMGSVWTFASVLAQIFEPFGLSAQLAGIAGAANVVLGVVTAYVVGLWVDRVRRYKIPVVVSLVGSLLCVISLMVVMLKMAPHTNAFSGVVTFLYILAGAFQNTAAPIAFEFAMELTYPLPESVPGALLMAGANLVSLIMVTVASALLGDGVAAEKSCVNVIIMIIVVGFVGTVLSFFARERLNRYAAERAAKALAEEEANAVPGAVAIAEEHEEYDPQPARREGSRE